MACVSPSFPSTSKTSKNLKLFSRSRLFGCMTLFARLGGYERHVRWCHLQLNGCKFVRQTLSLDVVGAGPRIVLISRNRTNLEWQEDRSDFCSLWNRAASRTTPTFASSGSTERQRAAPVVSRATPPQSCGRKTLRTRTMYLGQL